MGVIKLDSFSGDIPKLSPKALPDNAAETALNSYFDNGKIRGTYDSLCLEFWADGANTNQNIPASQGDILGRVDAKTRCFTTTTSGGDEYVEYYRFEVTPGELTELSIAAPSITDPTVSPHGFLESIFGGVNAFGTNDSSARGFSSEVYGNVIGSVWPVQNDFLVRDLMIFSIPTDASVSFLVFSVKLPAALLPGVATEHDYISHLKIGDYFIDFDSIVASGNFDTAGNANFKPWHNLVDSTNSHPFTLAVGGFTAGTDTHYWVLPVKAAAGEYLLNGKTNCEIKFKANKVPYLSTPGIADDVGAVNLGGATAIQNTAGTPILHFTKYQWSRSPADRPPELTGEATGTALASYYYRTEFLQFTGDLTDTIKPGDFIQESSRAILAEVVYVAYHPRFLNGAVIEPRTHVYFKRVPTLADPTPYETLLPDVSIGTYPYTDALAGTYINNLPGSATDSFTTAANLVVYRNPYIDTKELCIVPGEKGGKLIPSPITQDKFNRVYWNNGEYPVVASALDASFPDSKHRYVTLTPRKLGVVTPTTVPKVTVTDTGNNLGYEYRTIYVFTYVNDFGEEGPPSLGSAPVVFYEGWDIDVDIEIDSVILQAEHNFGDDSFIRLYRLVSGSQQSAFQFVKEEPLGPVLIAATATNTITIADDVLTRDLGEVLPSKSWNAPPSEDFSLFPNAPLKSIISMAYGGLAGFTKRTILFSEKDLPHAWPPEYQINLNQDIIKLSPLLDGLLALTTGAPVLISGDSPDTMAVQDVDIAFSCVSAESVVDMGGVTIYASTAGLIAISTQVIDLLTKDHVDQETWQQRYDPTSIRAYRHKNKYVAYFDKDIITVNSAQEVGAAYICGFEYDFQTRQFTNFCDPIAHNDPKGDNPTGAGGNSYDVPHPNPSAWGNDAGFYDVESNSLLFVATRSLKNPGYVPNASETKHFFEYDRNWSKVKDCIWKSKPFIYPKPILFSYLQLRLNEAALLESEFSTPGGYDIVASVLVYADDMVVGEYGFAPAAPSSSMHDVKSDIYLRESRDDPWPASPSQTAEDGIVRMAVPNRTNTPGQPLGGGAIKWQFVIHIRGGIRAVTTSSRVPVVEFIALAETIEELQALS